MKSFSLHRNNCRSFFVISLIFLLTTSCGSLTSRRSLFGDDDEEVKTQNKMATVPKEQYDQLMAKYKKLQRGIQESNDSAPVPEPVASDTSSVVNALSGVSSNENLVETVDVFSNSNGVVAKSQNMNLSYSDDYANMDVEGEIRKIQNAEALVKNNQLDKALSILKPQEASKVRQISVRAKFLVGEILFKQGEYDLAMQIYEGILSKDAFSGVVLKTLGRLIVCCEKLKIKKKQERYYSMLHDFFEA